MPDATVERFDITADFEGLIRLLAKNLYTEPEVFVRELVQNAHDAIALRSVDQPDLHGWIDISVDQVARLVTVRDNGIGMSRAEIREFLSVIGASDKGTIRDELSRAGHDVARRLIGQFGIGMLSAYVVADRIVVRSRRADESDGLEWSNSGSRACELRQIARDQPGTEVELHIAEGYEFVLAADHLTRSIVKYCDFIPYPIVLNGVGPVNATAAPWHKDHWTSPE